MKGIGKMEVYRILGILIFLIGIIVFWERSADDKDFED